MAGKRTVHDRFIGFEYERGGPGVITTIPNELTVATSPVVGEIRTCDTALAGVLAQLSANEPRLQPAAFTEFARSTVAKEMNGPFRAAQAKAIEADRANVAADARLMELPNDPASIARRAARRAALPSEPNALASALGTGDHETLQSFLEMPGSTSELIVTAARERAMLLGHIRASGLQANHQLSPTAADPLRHGPDEAAAMQHARTAKAWRDDQREAVTLTRTTLSQIIDIVAVATDMDRDTAFALLTSDGDA